MTKTLCMILIFSSFLSIAPMSFGDSIAPESTKDQNSPFVRMLEALYDRAMGAEKNGDVAIVRETRTATMLRSMRSDDVEAFSAVLKENASDQNRYQEFQFLGCESAGDKARLNYGKDMQETGPAHQPLIRFLSIWFHQDQGTWKVGPIGAATSSKFRKDGTLAENKDWLPDTSLTGL